MSNLGYTLRLDNIWKFIETLKKAQIGEVPQIADLHLPLKDPTHQIKSPYDLWNYNPAWGKNLH